MFKAIKIVTLLAMVSSAVVLSGCAASLERAGQNFQREVSGGYPARVTFYSLDGKLLKTWEAKRVLPMRDSNGDPSADFIIDGRKITIQGLYVIEEL